ncbi:U3 small nucleolar RNA-associated protein 6-like protein [Elysia marginata]|uniref:U3 small nucleolar RNA-associated protein 6-like protein n=1 Tax=Elysia marginata TaxID=1093978 RepID=A0AAV4END9_9GAST|nr:U3 small nucleolar RNA-associated protein 6-like protein [Elysia marginata]
MFPLKSVFTSGGSLEWPPLDLLPKILSLSERALRQGTVSEEISARLLELLTDLGMTDDLPEVTSRLTDLHPNSAHLWLTRMKQEAKQSGKGVVKVLSEALRKVPAEESWSLWEFALNFSAANESEVLEDLMESFKDNCMDASLYSNIDCGYGPVQEIETDRGDAVVSQSFAVKAMLPMGVITSYVIVNVVHGDGIYGMNTDGGRA